MKLWRYSLFLAVLSLAVISNITHAALSPAELAVIINVNDPYSVDIGRYYQEKRGIPDDNLVYVSFEPGKPVMPVADFERIKKEVDKRTPNHVQAFALTWTQPYRVACMSITSAFALGFDEGYCSQGCVPTLPSPYFASNSKQPYYDFGIRPTMSLAGEGVSQVRSLIRRGVAADFTAPVAKGFVLKTSDKNRNVRARNMKIGSQLISDTVLWSVLERDDLQHQRDLMFYFTGLKHVPHLDSNGFLPGAVGDHLTSTGGKLTGGAQMSSLRWLEAGATGSYGSVVEPCNFVQKFPNPELMARNYLQGDTLIEAYWKSVQMPGQGIFIGEPLARPYGK